MSSRGRVLIVEDDWIVSQEFSRILERGGFEVVHIAANAEDALRLFDEARPDVVVLDVDLGGAVDGIELASAIGIIAPAALVFVTGLTDDRTMDRVKAVGSLGYVVKPVSDLQLRSAVELALYRFRAEQEIVAREQVAEAAFSELFNAAPDAMVVVDAAGRILLANVELERRFGYTAGAIKGELVEVLIPEAAWSEHVKHRDWFGRHPHNRRLGELMHLSARRADGSELPVDVSLTTIGTGPGLRVIAIIRDTSERKLIQQAASERRAIAEQFERALRLETVGRLAGGIAHDFNNLLMVIGGYAESLLNDTSDPTKTRRSLEGIRATTNRAAELTRQLLAFGRRQVLQPVVVDLSAAVTSILDMLSRVIGEDIQVVTTSVPSLWRIKVDQTQLEQVLLNLALNARDAMPNGGTLKLETTNFQVVEPLPLPSSSVAVVPPDKYVLLAVRDDGCGMEPEIATHAFEPFFTTKAPGKGTGLGLSTIYGIVKQSGGFVWIESLPGRGTSVYVLLPATSEMEVASETIDQIQVHERGAGTVLLVEDESEVRALLVESLAKAGYDVIDRANGRDALEVFLNASGRIHLIITDVVMPQSSGPALVRAARLHQPDVKALYMSGYADDQMVAEIRNDTHSGYLPKPFSRAVLLKKISALLIGQSQ